MNQDLIQAIQKFFSNYYVNTIHIFQIEAKFLTSYDEMYIT